MRRFLVGSYVVLALVLVGVGLGGVAPHGLAVGGVAVASPAVSLKVGLLAPTTGVAAAPGHAVLDVRPGAVSRAPGVFPDLPAVQRVRGEIAEVTRRRQAAMV